MAVRNITQALGRVVGRALSWRNRSFAFQFYATLVPCILLVNLVVAGLAAAWGISWAGDVVRSNRTHTIQSLVFAISKPLHDFEFEHVNSLLLDIPRRGSIESVWVTDDTGFVVARADFSEDVEISGVTPTPIIHNKANAAVPVGTLYVAYSNGELFTIAAWTVLHSLMITLATTVAAIVIVIRISQKSVVSPLRYLSAAIDRTRQAGTRYRVHHTASGEFATVIDAFNAMQERLDRDERALREANAGLQRAATHDSLTGLLNRAGFEEQARRALQMSETDNGNVVLMFIDLNRFKSINDTFGHAVGDEVLQTVGRRILRAIPTGATAARLSGDEFVVMVAGGRDISLFAQQMARAIVSSVGVEFFVGEHSFKPLASIGYVVSEGDYVLSSLMVKADAAMYEMKRTGARKPTPYTPVVEQRAQARRGTEQALLDALEHDYFSIVTQPIIDLHSLKAVGGEVLLRLAHPERGNMSPAQFIPVAEECGLMPRIGLQVFRKAADALSRLPSQGPVPSYLSVNVSSLQISQSFLDRMNEIICQTGIDRRRLVLELTENVALKDDDDRRAVIRDIQESGIRVALDDFGTGYSSLAYIANLRPDIVKIDRSFVQAGAGTGGETRKRMMALREAMTAICCDLSLPMVGEGIETEQDLAWCRRAGIRYGQGYLFARPMPSHAFRDWMKLNSPEPSPDPAYEGDVLLSQIA